MKQLVLAFGWMFSFFFCLQSFGQNENDKRNLAIQYAKEANRLDLQSNPDSITQAYNLHCKVLTLDKKYSPSYRSKISIECKRGEYNSALKSAIAYVTNLPESGDAWVYLGIIQTKLNDTTGAINSFERAINVYEILSKKIKDKSWKEQLEFKKGIVGQFLGTNEPTFTFTKENQKREITVSMTLKEANSIDSFVEKFMTYNGIQFF